MKWDLPESNLAHRLSPSIDVFLWSTYSHSLVLHRLCRIPWEHHFFFSTQAVPLFSHRQVRTCSMYLLPSMGCCALNITALGCLLFPGRMTCWIGMMQTTTGRVSPSLVSNGYHSHIRTHTHTHTRMRARALIQYARCELPKTRTRKRQDEKVWPIQYANCARVICEYVIC